MKKEIKLIPKLLGKIISCIPTVDNILTFSSYPDYTDNSYAMFKYIASNDQYDKYKLVWLYWDENKYEIIKKEIESLFPKTKLVKKTSLLGLWYAIRSRHNFNTHGFYEALPIHQHSRKNINLWHGMPFKRIGYLDEYTEGFCPNTNLTIAPSIIYQEIMAKSFGLSTEQVLVTGQPRCDMLFEESDFFQSVGIDRKAYRKVGIWLPTYRNGVVGDKHMDGVYKDGMITFLDMNKLLELNSHLLQNDDLMIIKLHPMDKLQDYNFESYSNLIIIKQKEFNSQLYPLIGNCDYLLTDYSSVWIDYDTIRKPMAFVMDDMEQYTNTRGFNFDNPLDILPGPIISNYDDLLKFIDNPYYTPAKVEVNSIYDNKSAQRIAEYLGL